MADAIPLVPATLPLSEQAVEGTIRVFVGDSPQLTGWTYDPLDNRIVFDPAAAPPAGAAIEIRYDRRVECDGG